MDGSSSASRNAMISSSVSLSLSSTSSLKKFDSMSRMATFICTMIIRWNGRQTLNAGNCIRLL